jgi:hypothetical protein
MTARQKRIECAIQDTTDRRTLRLLNRAWWREFFRGKSDESSDRDRIFLLGASRGSDSGSDRVCAVADFREVRDMDTKYFHQALEEWKAKYPDRGHITMGSITMDTLSALLQRAEELKDADRPAPNRALDRMGA